MLTPSLLIWLVCCGELFCLGFLFAFFFLTSLGTEERGWAWRFAGPQDIGSIWVESFLSTVAVVTRACSSHIWLSSTALTSCALCWPWQLPRGWGKGIFFFSISWSPLLSVCDHSHHTARKASLTLRRPQGKVQFYHLVEKVLRAAMQLLPCFFYLNLEVVKLSSSSLLSKSCWWCPPQNCPPWINQSSHLSWLPWKCREQSIG